ncbi:ATP-binding protein [Streptomyces sp. NPDC086081]|uniref:ATP-binding protein n=1 Tax=Streptomyces sp. NPDC086081 TaxID=3365749 RepID=UPI0037FF23E0
MNATPRQSTTEPHERQAAYAYPLPHDEAGRLAALHALEILGTPREERFDRITRFARDSLQVPIALITLVDTDRQWYKSCQGLPNDQTPRGVSFCTYAILSDDIYEVTDASQDPVFSDNPTVTGPPYLRFYAGQPIRAPEGHRVGTLCVLDRQPRQLTPEQRQRLRDLAGWAELELHAVTVYRAARETEKLRHRLNSVLDAAAEGIVALDTAGTVVLANPAAEKLVGWHEHGGLKGRDFHRTVHSRHPDGTPYPSVDCPVHSLLQERGVVTAQEDTFWRRDGTPLPVRRSAATVTEAGRPTGAVLVFEDISLEQEVTRAKDEFAAMISHELRTPLTSIRGSLALMASGTFGELPAGPLHDLLGMALTNTDRLVRLATGVLDYERLSSGRMPLRRAPASLRDLVSASLDTVRGAADAAGIGLKAEVPSPITLHVDADRIVQALVNLLGNAIKFSRRGHAVTVLVRRSTEGSTVYIDVTDTGRGIPPDAVGRIFDRFRQADSSDARDHEGAGLGLALVKSIIEAHDGTVTVRSSIGAGSTFTITLPTSDGTEPS